MFILWILIGNAIGIAVTYLVMRKHSVGTLILTEDEDGMYISAALDCRPESFRNEKFVIFNVSHK